MCFGNNTTTKTVNENKNVATTGATEANTNTSGSNVGASYNTGTQTQGVPEWLTNASQGNIDYLSTLRDNGYQSYGGPRVADMSADENSAGGMVRALAGSGNPYQSQIEQLFGNYANSGPQSVGTSRVIDNVPGQGASGSTQDYMDPYLQSVLAPQLRQISQQSVDNQKALDRRATMGGAFGDARSGFEAAQNTRDTNNLMTDTTGRAYSAAYNDAMNRKNTDINRLLDVGKTNAGYNEQGLLRALQGGQAFQGLDKYDTGRQADLATMLSGFGKTQRDIDQNKLNASYEEFSKATGYPLEVSKLLMSAINGTPYDKTTTSTGTAGQTANTSGTSNTSGTQSGTQLSNGVQTTQQPDNSGFGILGALGGTALKALLAPATGGASMFMPSGTASMAPSPNGPNTYSPMFG